MSGPAALPPEMEIANLEHELAVLRERYANLLVETERQRRIFKYGSGLVVAVTGALVIYSVSKSNDPFPILFLLTGLIVAIGLILWLCNDWFAGDDKSRFRSPNHLYPYSYPFNTDEEFLNHAIAVRETRLRELKATS
jgi:hypothetical protein